MKTYFEALASRIELQALPPEPAGRRSLIGVVLLALMLLALCTFFGGYHSGFHTINGAASLVPRAVLQSVTYMGDTLFALTMMLIFARRHPQILWTAVVAAVIAFLLSRGLKLLLELPRPALVLDPGSFHLEGPRYRRGSFPSGHSVTLFTLAAVFASYLPTLRAQATAFLLALLVATSRVLVGAHWPVDLLAGAVVGCMSVLASLGLVRRWTWGLRVDGHLVLVALLSGCAVAMLVLPLPYPKAEPMARTVAALALAIAAWNYGAAPWLILELGAWGRRIRGLSVSDRAE